MRNISLTTVFIGVISLVGAAIVYSAMARPAEAQVSCMTYGNMTTCTSPQGSTTCMRYGNMVTCN